jgi:hypothetical protein
MSLDQDAVIEEFQLMYDVLMQVAEDHDVDPDIADIASAAANELEVQFIDSEAEDEDELEDQYDDFIDLIESVLDDLDENEADNTVMGPIRKRLTKAKKLLL